MFFFPFPDSTDSFCILRETIKDRENDKIDDCDSVKRGFPSKQQL